MSSYPFKEIEAKWQEFWERSKTFKVTEDPAVPREKRRYVLDMFPYPSSAGLHVGHPEGYTATDIYCRYLKMKGYNVLHPMGFDSFGLPAENYAIKTGTHPRISTEANINMFRRQIKSLGFCYDWDREISTCDPGYYHWTQWIFLQIFKMGLAYEAEIPINWCPSCKTGLANEEVKEGACERCRTPVVRRNIRQWLLAITKYADRLLEDLDELDWPESIKTAQRTWIGRSEGADVIFKLEGERGEIKVYTTRPDTLFGATYMVLAPEHPLVQTITTPEQRGAVAAYAEAANSKSDLERTDLAKTKTGVWTGAYAINPVNGARIPVWVADYVLISYGFGAIMAVPAHDSRDWEFAKKFDLPIIEVLQGGNVEEEAWTGDGPHVNSDWLNGMNTGDAIAAITAWLAERGLGQAAVNYKLRDWVFARQRYWGEPMPLVHCPQCGVVPLPEESLPLTLPEASGYLPTGTGESPLAAIEDWVRTACPRCGGPARRETNTMPQWAGSCWYYLRYLDPANPRALADKEKIDYWMPVDLYVGGQEHAVLHLLYARFWHKVLYDLGVVSQKEPFVRLINQGMITSFAYQRANKSLVSIDEVEEREPGVFVEKASGETLIQVVAKMSKSLKNVINPDEVIREYGSDSMRLYEMFMGPLEVSKPWSTKGVMGVSRFLDRVWRLGTERALTEEPLSPALEKLLHRTIKKVDQDTSRLEFNTAISQMMICVNELYKEENLNKRIWEPFILLLCPYAPHLAEELWSRLGHAESLSREAFPEWKEELTREDLLTLVVQVNGKVRAKVSLPPGLNQAALEGEALNNPRIQSLIEGKELLKVITVPDKLVNLVVR
ncbi:MAG: leucine--tRNA ligase [Spirochaetales bacterium]|jgi:leucyl-tRNA synthetase|nr:leucine--tRNA ligase [Spirochaetales bacterium]